MTFDTAKARELCVRGSATVTALELQGELLAATVEVELLRDRIATIAWEKIGPHPVEAAEESLTRIESALWERGRELEQARAEAQRADAARDRLSSEIEEEKKAHNRTARDLAEAQRDLADMQDAVKAAYGGQA